ncbi:MAG TPA: class I SAM-dependent methyltransferase [bacterium]|nr:class I SAM-dependent methyltransferase [bacterium]
MGVKCFDRMAAAYTNGWVKCAKKRDEIRRFTARFGLEKGMTIIEPGCGSGEFTPFLLAEAGKNGRVICVDSSSEMSKLAKQRLKAGKNARVIKACASKMPVKSGSADAVICFNCFPHFYPKERFIREFHRVLKPGGLLVIAHDASSAAINGMHRRIGFNMKKHGIPAPGEMRKMLYHADFVIECFKSRGRYMLAARKQ